MIRFLDFRPIHFIFPPGRLKQKTCILLGERGYSVSNFYCWVSSFWRISGRNRTSGTGGRRKCVFHSQQWVDRVGHCRKHFAEPSYHWSNGAKLIRAGRKWARASHCRLTIDGACNHEPVAEMSEYGDGSRQLFSVVYPASPCRVRRIRGRFGSRASRGRSPSTEMVRLHCSCWLRLIDPQRHQRWIINMKYRQRRSPQRCYSLPERAVFLPCGAISNWFRLCASDRFDPDWKGAQQPAISDWEMIADWR